MTCNHDIHSSDIILQVVLRSNTVTCYSCKKPYAIYNTRLKNDLSPVKIAIFASMAMAEETLTRCKKTVLLCRPFTLNLRGWRTRVMVRMKKRVSTSRQGVSAPESSLILQTNQSTRSSGSLSHLTPFY